MKFVMHFYNKLSTGHYEIVECYRIGVIEKRWEVLPDLFIDILNPTKEELFQYNTFIGELPPAHLLKELLCRI